MAMYIGHNHACSIECIGTVHFPTNGTNELILYNVHYVLGIKKSFLVVGKWICIVIAFFSREDRGK